MIKAVIFDFDGVIVESADIKTEAFKELFVDYPESLEEITEYHLINAGISRYVKFRYIYKQILRRQLSQEEEIGLGKRFSQIVLEKILNAPFVAGAKEFLDANKNRYQFFVASGTPEEELRSIIDAKRLGGYFKKIFGSPKQKTDIIRHIIGTYNFESNELIFVGDAESDLLAADRAEIIFVKRDSALATRSEAHPWVIKDLFDLRDVIKEIES